MRQRAYKSLERSIPLLIAIGIAFFSALQVISVSILVRSQFSELEEDDLQGRKEQFRVLLERELTGIKNLVKSYAEWQVSLDYMKSFDPAYIESNYNRDWLVNQDLDIVSILDVDGDLLWSSDTSISIGRETGPGHFSTQDRLLFPEDFGALPPNPVSGFAARDGIPVLYVAWPITDDNVSERPMGLLVFGRVLDGAALESFSPGENFWISFLPGPRGAMDAAPLSRIEKSGLADELSAYDEVRDPVGGLLGYWHLGMTTAWSAAAGSLIVWLGFIAIVSGIGCYAISAFIVHKRMVRPIRRIRDYLDRFSETFLVESPLSTYNADEFGELSRHVNSLVERVIAQTRELDRLACTDGLTGLFNRRRLDETLESLATKAAVLSAHADSRSLAKRGMLACGLIDIDFFKRFNDLYGHAAGDDALRKIAVTIRDGVKRPEDLPSRYGGEEFVVVLPDTDEQGAYAVLERIRAAVEALGIVHGGSDISSVVTVSAGVAILPSYGGAHASENLLGLADRALYAAKDAGRNRVVMASTLEEE